MGVYEMKFRNGDFYYPETGRGLRANEDMAILFGLAGVLLTSQRQRGSIYRLRYNPVINGGQFVERLQ